MPGILTTTLLSYQNYVSSYWLSNGAVFILPPSLLCLLTLWDAVCIRRAGPQFPTQIVFCLLHRFCNCLSPSQQSPSCSSITPFPTSSLATCMNPTWDQVTPRDRSHAMSPVLVSAAILYRKITWKAHVRPRLEELSVCYP